MTRFLRLLLSRLFGRPAPDWEALDYGKPATVEDDLAQLNDERL